MATNLSVSQISMPKGGGAIQGLAESFEDQEFTGTFSLSIPVPVTPCRDFAPALTIDYGSGAGNGVFGLGFSLSLPYISRKTSKSTPRYDSRDTFLLSGAEDLVLSSDVPPRSQSVGGIAYEITTFRPRFEETYAQIEQWRDLSSEESHWRKISRDNVISVYGKTDNARIADPDDPTRIYQWLISETFDAKGNYVSYTYESDGGLPAGALCEANRRTEANRYISRIRYGYDKPYQGEGDPPSHHFEVVFDYGAYSFDLSQGAPCEPLPDLPAQARRKDSFSAYQAGFEIRTTRLCRHIAMFHLFENELGPDPVLTHLTRFIYSETETAALLAAVESAGCRYEDGKYTTLSLPPLELGYAGFQPEDRSFELLAVGSKRNMPALGGTPETMLVDLYGEGIPGMLYHDDRTAYYWSPVRETAEATVEGTRVIRYAPPEEPLQMPNALCREPGAALTDLTGNGRLDLVVPTGGGTGYFEMGSGWKWEQLRMFPSFTNDFFGADHEYVDVTGDGIPDVVVFEEDRIVIYPSLGPDGFDKPYSYPAMEGLPLPRSGSAHELVSFADMFGTGGQHLVCIRNGRVQCWPNLGYGRFGKPVDMDNAPRFDGDFDPSRVFLADIDGSGTADLLYAYPDRIEVFFNRSGNSFSEPFVLRLPAVWDHVKQISLADVHGIGTSCLVFSELIPEPVHWCFDFTGRVKPYLLTRIVNNLGARTTVSYSSSTRHYLEDKAGGMPWIVNLPFPVHVVDKIVTEDLISETRLVRSYRYHHGHYDHTEREFRGFGMVERQDAETLGAGAAPADVPPILTKTWYHTGASLEHDVLSKQYGHEYDNRDPSAFLLPDSVFDCDDYTKRNPGYTPNAEDWREACRALKGHMLREEVYSVEEPVRSEGEQADAPYTVSEYNFTVRLLQPKGPRLYAAMAVFPRETLHYDYERNPADPRIDHEMELEVDEFGFSTRSASIYYGRRPSVKGALPEQLAAAVTLTTERLLHIAGENERLLGVPVERRRYEIKRVQPPAGGFYFAYDDMKRQLAAVDGDSDDTPMLEWERRYYWDPAQSDLLPLGQSGPQELLGRVETAVCRSSSYEEAFGSAMTVRELETLLETNGGYVKDGSYWFNPGPMELYGGPSSFYLPAATVDPFGNKTEYGYDDYSLMLVKVIEPLLGATSVGQIDYVSLQPQRMTDANGIVSEARYDPLGRAAVRSRYGQEFGQPAGFARLDDYVRQSRETAEFVLDRPDLFLQGAEQYTCSDLLSWMGTIDPDTLASAAGADAPLLWQELVRKGWIGWTGGILQRLKDLTDPNALQLGSLFDGKQAEILRLLQSAKGGQPVHTISLTASGYPSGNRNRVQPAIFADLPVDTQALWSELVSLGYIDADGAVSERVWSMPGSEELLLGDAYAASKSDIYDRLRSGIHLHITYSDGFARILQEKSKVESGEAHLLSSLTGPAEPVGGLPVGPTERRWLATGRKVYDNKGNPVQQYEPFYTDEPLFDANLDLLPFGVSSTLRYDPLGRVVQVVTGKGFVKKEVWTPWGETSWDENDTLPESPYYAANVLAPDPSSPYYDPGLSDEGRAVLENTKAFANTPETLVYDAMSRTIRDIRVLEDGTRLVQTNVWDIRGHLLSSGDPRLSSKGTANFRYTYDWSGHAYVTDSADAGSSHKALVDTSGQPIFIEDPNGNRFWMYYDALGRMYRKDEQPPNGAKTTSEYIVYGESLPPAEAKAHNLIGQKVMHFDQAGLLQMNDYDLRGLPVSYVRRYAMTYEQAPDWSDDARTRPDDALQSASYSFGYRYDAAGRLIRHEDCSGTVTMWNYHVSDRLLSVCVKQPGDTPPFPMLTVKAYNERGQRLNVCYHPAGGTQTRFEYDPRTYEVTRLVSSGTSLLQDLHYTYDPAGNVCRVRDDAAWELLTGKMADGGNPWAADYTYDAIYRLVRATGREAADPSCVMQLPLSDAGNLRSYTTDFQYDASGNLVGSRHQPETGTQTVCRLTVSGTSNRAVDSSLCADPAKVDAFFDANGNQLADNGGKTMIWNSRNEIAQITSEPASVREYYVYNAAGLRVRKVTETRDSSGEAAGIDEILYLGNVEIQRHYAGSPAETETCFLQNEKVTLRIKDDRQCFAAMTRWTAGKPDLAEPVQTTYTLVNHLGSCTLEIDDRGRPVSFEEYYPYGGTALSAGDAASKRYRFSGKEQDEPSGYYYFGARYYAPLAARWLSPDPAGTVDGLNLFAFVGGNPVTYRDPDGQCRTKSSGRGRSRSRSRSRGRGRSPSPGSSRRDDDRRGRGRSRSRSRDRGGSRSRSRDRHRDRRSRSPVLDRRRYHPYSTAADRRIRRMDSISRLFDVNGSVVTAVGYNQTDNVLVASVNKNYDNFKDEAFRRVRILKLYFQNDRHALSTREIASDLQRHGNTFSQNRLSRDLRSLRDHGGLPEGVANALKNGSFETIRPAREGVHAELTVAHDIQRGPLGVTLLNCQHCNDHLHSDYPDIQTRGTHGYSFPGWRDPSRNNRTRSDFSPPPENRRDLLLPEDSDSEDDRK